MSCHPSVSAAASTTGSYATRAGVGPKSIVSSSRVVSRNLFVVAGGQTRGGGCESPFFDL